MYHAEECPHPHDQLEIDRARGQTTCRACGTIVSTGAFEMDPSFHVRSAGGGTGGGGGSGGSGGQHGGQHGSGPQIGGPNIPGTAQGMLMLFRGTGPTRPPRARQAQHGAHGANRPSIEAARRQMSALARKMGLPFSVVDAATVMYRQAVTANAIVGARMSVLCACLYLVCRKQKLPQTVLDFSDQSKEPPWAILNYVRAICKVTHMEVPPADPSFYVARFAEALELGEQTMDITIYALKVLHAMKDDWIAAGRRPLGICAAAVLIACRMYDIDRTEKDYTKLARVGWNTIVFHVEEFARTPAAALESIDDYVPSNNTVPNSYSMGRARDALRVEEEKRRLAQADNYTLIDAAKSGAPVTPERMELWRRFILQRSKLFNLPVDTDLLDIRKISLKRQFGLLGIPYYNTPQERRGGSRLNKNNNNSVAGETDDDNNNNNKNMMMMMGGNNKKEQQQEPDAASPTSSSIADTPTNAQQQQQQVRRRSTSTERYARDQSFVNLETKTLQADHDRRVKEYKEKRSLRFKRGNKLLEDDEAESGSESSSTSSDEDGDENDKKKKKKNNTKNKNKNTNNTDEQSEDTKNEKKKSSNISSSSLSVLKLTEFHENEDEAFYPVLTQSAAQISRDIIFSQDVDIPDPIIAAAVAADRFSTTAGSSSAQRLSRSHSNTSNNNNFLGGDNLSRNSSMSNSDNNNQNNNNNNFFGNNNNNMMMMMGGNNNNRNTFGDSNENTNQPFDMNENNNNTNNVQISQAQVDEVAKLAQGLELSLSASPLVYSIERQEPHFDYRHSSQRNPQNSSQARPNNNNNGSSRNSEATNHHSDNHNNNNNVFNQQSGMLPSTQLDYSQRGNRANSPNPHSGSTQQQQEMNNNYFGGGSNNNNSNAASGSFSNNNNNADSSSYTYLDPVTQHVLNTAPPGLSFHGLNVRHRLTQLQLQLSTAPTVRGDVVRLEVDDGDSDTDEYMILDNEDQIKKEKTLRTVLANKFAALNDAYNQQVEKLELGGFLSGNNNNSNSNKTNSNNNNNNNQNQNNQQQHARFNEDDIIGLLGAGQNEGGVDNLSGPSGFLFGGEEDDDIPFGEMMMSMNNNNNNNSRKPKQTRQNQAEYESAASAIKSTLKKKGGSNLDTEGLAHLLQENDAEEFDL